VRTTVDVEQWGIELLAGTTVVSPDGDSPGGLISHGDVRTATLQFNGIREPSRMSLATLQRSCPALTGRIRPKGIYAFLESRRLALDSRSFADLHRGAPVTSS
jgi:hypothetical protein